MKPLTFAITALLTAALLIPAARADTALGDWGHFLSYNPKTFLEKPDGRPFSVSVHVMQWGSASWNKERHSLRLTAPDGEVIHEGELRLEDAVLTLEIEEAQKGVYVLEPKGNVWISSTLGRSVLWTGETGGHMVEDRRAVFQAVVPRRWWFYVPDDVTEFTAIAQRADRYMSQREKWGFFIVSPRGQRTNALWGQPPRSRPGQPYRQEQVATVEVEPGSGGRFWYAEIALGDSHDYSNINFALQGVPPYLARSPEEWFNPEEEASMQALVYDSTPFIQAAKTDMLAQRWPNLQHFSPSPSLGDPDGVQVMGDARFALWNPEGRELGFRIGTYLPRKLAGEPDLAAVKIVGPGGGIILEKDMPLQHIHGEDGHPTDVLDTGAGVSMVRVRARETWMSFTYPATPLVLLGAESPEGWHHYNFTVCAPRNWYFFVPRGTSEFDLDVAAELPDDVVKMEICSPDRTVAMIYDHTAQRRVQVPPGMDGKIWYLRPSVASASRLITSAGPAPRYQNIRLGLRIKGLPNGLAPTWEQWFDYQDPMPARLRADPD